MSLNPAQQAAAESDAKLKIVIAGPGSGKTRTEVAAVCLAMRGKQNRTDGQYFMKRAAVMTFTNSAANEFRKRLGDIEVAYCGTLHGWCYKLIQRFGGFLGYISGKVGILPDAERIPRLLACREKFGGGKIITEALLTKGKPGCHPFFDLIWQEYEFLLKRNNLVDYDGILRVALRLLQLPEVRAWVRLDYLFVDEYQDSAQIDQAIYEAIPAEHKMYVGDPDQSIFAFRGAFSLGLVTLAAGLAEVHKLELNYRSDMDICTVANALIRHNKERVEKEIIPVSTLQGVTLAIRHEDVGQELSWLVAAIRRAWFPQPDHAELAPGETIGVLYRMNRDVKQCRDYLQAMGIPVQTQKWEAKPADWERALLLLALAGSPDNEILAERYLRLDNDAATVKHWILQSRAGVRSLADHCVKVVAASLHSAPRYLAENGVGESTIAALKARVALLPPDADLSDLLHDLHSGEETKEATSEGVYVGTIHSAKGREFDVVFLPAFEQGIIPAKVTFVPDDRKHDKMAETATELLNWKLVEEERRLAFVGVTRARRELYISHVEHRRGPYGPVGLGQPSQFIKEMGL